MITDAKLRFWIDHNFNVLFVGEHGVGKTARVKQAFEEAGLKWLYFSAATLDPWVDFIGIPKEAQDEKGNKYIELIRPKPFAEDQVEAIFLDEFNRSPKKVRNAVMELLQFKSINGKKFNNLRIVWAAINPDDIKLDGNDELEYDVEKLDPAQKDRFEVQVTVPFKPDRKYFNDKFGEDICRNAIDWWNDLDQKVKRDVSPRRLDYALDMYIKGGDLRDVLPPNVNVSKLITELKNGSFVKRMMDIFAQQNVEEAKNFLAVRNNFDNTIGRIIVNENMLRFFGPCIKEEDLVNLMSSEKRMYDHVIANHEKYEDVIKSIMDVNSNSKLANRLKKEPELNTMATTFRAPSMAEFVKKLTFSNPSLKTKPVVKNQCGVLFSNLGGQSFTSFINDSTVIVNALRKGTQYRIGIYHKILKNISDSESNADYLTALKHIVDIIGSSHKSSLKQTVFNGLPELFGYLVNRCAATASTGTACSNQSVIVNIQVKNDRKLEEFLIANATLYA